MGKAGRIIILIIICFGVPLAITFFYSENRGNVFVWLFSLSIIPLASKLLLGKTKQEEPSSSNDIT